MGCKRKKKRKEYFPITYDFPKKKTATSERFSFTFTRDIDRYVIFYCVRTEEFIFLGVNSSECMRVQNFMRLQD